MPNLVDPLRATVQAIGQRSSTTKRMVMALTVVFCPTAPALLTVDKLSLPKIMHRRVNTLLTVLIELIDGFFH